MSKEIEIMKKYIHIDNGGYEFKIKVIDNGDAAAGLPDGYYLDSFTISNSFYGYSDNIMILSRLNVDDLRKLGEALLVAANKINDLNKTSQTV